MKTPSKFPVSGFLALCAVFLAGSQAGLAQAQNNNPNPNPNPTPTPVPRKVAKKKPGPEAAPVVTKQVVPPVQKRIEQPKMPPGMKFRAPKFTPAQLRDLTKLKLMPPMKREGNGQAGLALPKKGRAEIVSKLSFPQIGGLGLGQAGTRRWPDTYVPVSHAGTIEPHAGTIEPPGTDRNHAGFGNLRGSSRPESLFPGSSGASGYFPYQDAAVSFSEKLQPGEADTSLVVPGKMLFEGIAIPPLKGASGLSSGFPVIGGNENLAVVVGSAGTPKQKPKP